MSENINLDDPKIQSAFATAEGINNPTQNKLSLGLPEVKPIWLLAGGAILFLIFKDRILDFILGDR